MLFIVSSLCVISILLPEADPGLAMGSRTPTLRQLQGSAGYTVDLAHILQARHPQVGACSFAQLLTGELARPADARAHSATPPTGVDEPKAIADSCLLRMDNRRPMTELLLARFVNSFFK